MFHDILEDSWSYQEIVQKGLDKGREQGLDQGKLIAARSFITRIIEKHFPPLLPLAQKKVPHMKTLAESNSIIDKLLEVQTLEQARQVLEEMDQQPHG